MIDLFFDLTGGFPARRRFSLNLKTYVGLVGLRL